MAMARVLHGLFPATDHLLDFVVAKKADLEFVRVERRHDIMDYIF